MRRSIPSIRPETLFCELFGCFRSPLNQYGFHYWYIACLRYWVGWDVERIDNDDSKNKDDAWNRLKDVSIESHIPPLLGVNT